MKTLHRMHKLNMAKWRGWLGDVPRFAYSIDKLKSLGWLPKLNSSQAIQKAIINY